MAARGRLVTMLGGVVLVGGLLAVGLWPRTEPVDVATVAQGPLMVTVEDEGRTRVHDRFLVSAPVAGRVLRLTLDPGDAVTKGQIVARIQPEMPRLLDERTRAEADAAVRAAEASLGRAQAEQARADAALMHAQRERKRAAELRAEGLVSAQEFEAREADVRTLTEAAGAAAFSVHAAQADLRRARATLTPAGTPAGAAVDVRAPASGVVLRRTRESESVVPAGDALLEIGDPGKLEVVVDLLSADAARVRPGAKAFIEAPGGSATPASALPATVRRVEPSGFTKVSALGVEEQRVNVILDLAAPSSGFGDAYRVDVRIVLWETARTLTMPATALFRNGEAWATYTVREGRARLTPVTIGHHGGRTVEVTGGVAEGATVIVHPSDRITDGTRVAAH